mgnify:CR=1 FL=1
MLCETLKTKGNSFRYGQSTHDVEQCFNQAIYVCKPLKDEEKNFTLFYLCEECLKIFLFPLGRVSP